MIAIELQRESWPLILGSLLITKNVLNGIALT